MLIGCGRSIRGIAPEEGRRRGRMVKLDVVFGSLKESLVSICIYSKPEVTYLDDVGIPRRRLNLSTVIADF
jgi:hypothetical protein